MKESNYIIAGLSLFFWGLLIFLKLINFIDYAYLEITSLVFVLFGFISVYNYLGTGFRGRLFFSSSILITGIIFYTVSNNDILNPHQTILPSILFVVGTGFITLFFDNSKEKIFISAGILLYFFSYLSLSVFKGLTIVKFANKFSLVVFNYWPIIILLLGINILIMRKK